MEYATDLDLWSTMSDFLLTPTPLDTLGSNDFGVLDAFGDFTHCNEISGYSAPSTPSTTEEESICGSPSVSYLPVANEPEPVPISWQFSPPLNNYQYQMPCLPQQHLQLQHQHSMQLQQLQGQQFGYFNPQEAMVPRCYSYPAPVPASPLFVPTTPLPHPKLEFPTDVIPLEPLPCFRPIPPPMTHVKSPLDSYSYNCCKSYDEPMSSMQQLGFSSHVQFTNLDASHFGTQLDPVKKLRSIPMDISGNLTDAQYYKIFKLYHLQLQLDSHPIMTEEDLEDIKLHGRMYFLKNVKTIVPKIGYWKFHAHLSHRRSDERQYNIPGMAVTCKVREWVTDDGLWRLYHFKKGKTVKSKRLYDI